MRIPVPLGIMPERIWKEKRLIELSSAIERYTSSYEQIPVEWIKEYNKLACELNQC